MNDKPIDWKTLQQLATEWNETGKFPEEGAQRYWAAMGVTRPPWTPGVNEWKDRK